MRRANREHLVCVAAALLLSASLGAQGGDHLAEHASHAPASPDERALRALLARYREGDVENAVTGLLAHPPEWSRTALDGCVRRAEEDIKYHRRAANRLSAARDEQLEQFLRADRLRVLMLTAALQLEASRAVAGVEPVGSYVVVSEHAVDTLYTLRGDFEEHGAVPWRYGRDDPPAAANDDGAERPPSVDWATVRAFVERWYPAAVSRLQHLVEMRLTPELVQRGLVRFPAHAELLLARGSFVETRLALARVDRSMAALLYPPDVRQRWRDELSAAQADFQRAVESGATDGEAAVRLARVRLLNGQADRGRELLDRLLAGDLPVEIRYLAFLFRAAAGEETGRLQDAARDYEAAAGAVPAAQTPLLALGRIADEQGRPADARTWVARALAAASIGADPWRRYVQGQGWQMDARMARLRTLARQ